MELQGPSPRARSTDVLLATGKEHAGNEGVREPEPRRAKRIEHRRDRCDVAACLRRDQDPNRANDRNAHALGNETPLPLVDQESRSAALDGDGDGLGLADVQAARHQRVNDMSSGGSDHSDPRGRRDLRRSSEPCPDDNDLVEHGFGNHHFGGKPVISSSWPIAARWISGPASATTITRDRA